MRKFLTVTVVTVAVSSLLAGGVFAAEAAPRGTAAGVRAATINAGDFSLQGLNQKTYTLSSYKNKQPALLFFWTTWCPYCRKALKALGEYSAEMQESNIAVMAINVGEDSAKVNSFISSNGIVFDVLLDSDSKVAHAYELLGVPTYVLVDKSGAIVFRGNYFPKGKFKELLAAK